MERRRRRRRNSIRLECAVFLFIIAGLAMAAYAVTIFEGWPFVILFGVLLWLSAMMRTR